LTKLRHQKLPIEGDKDVRYRIGIGVLYGVFIYALIALESIMKAKGYRPLARLLSLALAWTILIGLSVTGALWHFNRPWF